jgi:hypothetical protein
MVEGAVVATFPAVARAIAVAEAGMVAVATADDNDEELGVIGRGEVAHLVIQDAPPHFSGS